MMVKFQCESVSIEYIIVGCGSKVRNTCVLSQDKVFPLCYPEHCERYDILEVHFVLSADRVFSFGFDLDAE